MSFEEITNEELRKEIEELKAHNCMDRIEVSKTAADIVKFLTENQPTDPFLNRKMMQGYDGRNSDKGSCCNLI